RWTYPAAGEEGAITLEKGQEMGRFKLGSTVINLFAPGKITFMPQLSNGTVTRMGGAFAEGVRLTAAAQPEPVADVMVEAVVEKEVTQEVVAESEEPQPAGMAQAGVTKPATPPEEI
ncbi:MAG: phosphatidylserine decarboxylase, partial [Ewingella sp.]|nr:phosphatidylserine decarboxylase [Ewingella sp.]